MEVTSAKYYKDVSTDTNASIEATINGKNIVYQWIQTTDTTKLYKNW